MRWMGNDKRETSGEEERAVDAAESAAAPQREERGDESPTGALFGGRTTGALVSQHLYVLRPCSRRGIRVTCVCVRLGVWPCTAAKNACMPLIRLCVLSISACVTANFCLPASVLSFFARV